MSFGYSLWRLYQWPAFSSPFLASALPSNNSPEFREVFESHAFFSPDFFHCSSDPLGIVRITAVYAYEISFHVLDTNVRILQWILGS